MSCKFSHVEDMASCKQATSIQSTTSCNSCLLLAKDSLKLLAYIVQSSDMPASNVDGYKFVLASNEDGHGNHVVI